MKHLEILIFSEEISEISRKIKKWVNSDHFQPIP